MKVDAVFEGGGVKGIAFAGAISEIEKSGYEFENIAGTSAGAITAALLAVGYTSEEIREELEKLDYRLFKDSNGIGKLGFLGRLVNIVSSYGLYNGDYFENWFENLLEKKGKTTFGELLTGSEDEKYKFKLQIIATDITDKRVLVLPRDIETFGFIPEKLSISKAVRMSMSIPLFFKPVKLKDNNGKEHVIVDGGVLSNYPIWLLDDNTSDPPWPTFGFKLVEVDNRSLKKGRKSYTTNIVNYLQALIGTMISSYDRLHISRSKGDFDRTIGIPTTIVINGIKKEIRTTEFDITREESTLLYKNGEVVAREFLEKWDFETWKEKYRK